MKIRLHGGECCGVKHIHSLGCYPDIKIAARKAIKMTSFGRNWSVALNDMLSRNDRAKCDFFNEAAPEETYEARFRRMVKFIKKNRPHGIIEVIITPAQKNWRPIFKDIGFVEGVSAKNSNTSVTITVWLLAY